MFVKVLGSGKSSVHANNLMNLTHANSIFKHANEIDIQI